MLPDTGLSLKVAERRISSSPPANPAATYAEYIQKIEQSATVSIRRSFGADRTWTLTAVPDQAPKISFAGPVEVSPRGVLAFQIQG